MKNKDTVEIPKTRKNIIRNVIIFMFATIIIIAIVGIVLSRRLTPYMILEYDGYAVSNEEITQYLLGGIKKDGENRNIGAIKVKDQTRIYKDRKNIYYLGENRKKRLNMEYPIYINENISLYNMSNDITLITKKYEEVDGYANTTLVSGNLYNMSDLNRADYNEYIFLRNERGILVNTYDIKIETEGNSYKIPANSIVTFYEDYILYYTLDETIFVYNEILDIDLNSKVSIGNIDTMKYRDFLIKMKIAMIPEDKEEIKEPEEIIQEVPDDNSPKENIKEPKQVEQKKKEENKEDKVEEIEEQQVQENVVENPIDSIPVVTYITPEVNVTNWTANVYTSNVLINIYDPTGQITNPITFTITHKNKVYMRKAFTSSGLGTISGLLPNENYSVQAEYVYLNEEGESIKRVILNEDFSTKDTNSLNPISLGFEYGDIISNGLNLSNLKITSDVQDEAVYGLKQLTFFINKLSYNISSEKLRDLKNGKTVNYKLIDILKSNSSYDFEIKAYDVAGNEMNLKSNTGTVRTSKAVPNFKLNISTKDLTAVKVKIEVVNNDNIKVGNRRYVLYKLDGTVVKESTISNDIEEFDLYNLDPNTIYTIKIFGNYDLEDGKGIRENVKLADKGFNTVPISSLGNVYLKDDVKEITKDSVTLSLLLGVEKTDARLVYILNKINIKILKDGEIIKNKNLTSAQLDGLKTGEEIAVKFEGLDSITKYTVEITPTAVQGDVVEDVKANYNLKEFVTLKIPASVLIKNKFITESMIDFDVQIRDIDNAIKSDNIYFELRDSEDKIIEIERIDINSEFQRKNYSRLNPQTTYSMYFYAEQYNEGQNNSTFESNKLLLKLDFYTELGISGKIQLQNISRMTTGRNLIDVSSTIKWYSAVWNTNNYYGNKYYFDRNYNENVLRLLSGKGDGKNGAKQYYTYDFSDYIGQTVTFSFDARVDENSKDMKAYIQATKTDSNARLRTEISNLSTEWTHYTQTITIDNTGYAGFYLVASALNQPQYLYLRNVQVEKGKTATSYKAYEYNWSSSFIIDLMDKRDEIITNDYYLRLYKQENLLSENRYIEIDENNHVENSLKTFGLEDNQNYKVELLVKINERFYLLDALEFNTQGGEIKGIANLNDWLKIQPNGNYVVYNDLDFSGVNNAYRFGGVNLSFNGTIDFNGHTVIRNDSLSYIIYSTSVNAILKNFVLDVRIKNAGTNSYFALMYINYGLITNAIFNLTECIEGPHNTIALCCYRNTGIIEKFIVNYKVPLYCSRVCAGLSLYGTGTYRDGYVYGEDIMATGTMGNGNWRCIGGAVYALERNGSMCNIYSLINVKCSTVDDYEWTVTKYTWNNRTGSIVDSVDKANVYNLYSIGHGENYYITDKGKKPYGPTIGTISGNTKYKNIYYFDSDVLFDNSVNSSGSALALHDYEFQNQFLNSNKSFNIEPVNNGYFPHLDLAYCMPNQEYLELPEAEDVDLPDLLSLEVIEEDAENHELKVSMSIYNPDASNIVDIEVGNLTSEIIEQSYEIGKTQLIVKLSNPLTYVSKYDLLSITFQGAMNRNYKRKFASGERIINVDFYKNIYNITDWKTINSAPNQNYRLMDDLNFINEKATIAITKTFTAKIDGNGKTIKNIILPETNNGCFINTLNGTLKNLYIENYVQMPTINLTQIGLIKDANSSAIIDNVHIKGEKLSSSYITGDVYIGGLVTKATQAVITNSSVTDISIEIDKMLNSVRIGGLCATANSLRISNCYVQGINFNIYNPITSGGIGGILGREEQDGGFIQYCYAERKNRN